MAPDYTANTRHGKFTRTTEKSATFGHGPVSWIALSCAPGAPGHEDQASATRSHLPEKRIDPVCQCTCSRPGGDGNRGLGKPPSHRPGRLQQKSAPVAQLDRVLPSEGRGHRFESCRARHYNQQVMKLLVSLIGIVFDEKCNKSATENDCLDVHALIAVRARPSMVPQPTFNRTRFCI